jgi:hypothetical protein
MGDRRVNGTPILIADVLAVCRVAIGLTFAFSAAGKLRDITAFRQAIADLELFAEGWSKTIAICLLVAESAVAVMVAVGGPALVPGFLLAAGLLVVFSVALVLALRRGVRVACNCFGPAERSLSPYDVVRNLLLIGCSLVGVWALSTPRHDLASLDVALMVVMGTCLVVLLTNLSDVVTTLRRPFSPPGG